ncbi:hypothetical protein H4S04_001465 [Coemansia sp. S16]|nr:hypothetical protein H4S03_000643 [Coemansia sp. S3946]KAJ2052254.1 hypothetical protein H4S04_001465 [Coemansia sp. S16]KAJ2067742.1 hypothetical protein GGI08_001218 [Coemansia sp. S2]KAJ2336115.1 hypothetical protein GGH92_007844 [Coemansia sp. RSA 2673]KAJ2430937.1 hypothetical protein GGF41_000769 [Coemansia sp. RSA 2531]
MRFFVILAILGCLLALCHAKRKIEIKNEKLVKETYYSDDEYGHRVSSKFNGTSNMVASTGGPTMFYKDKKCKEPAFLYKRKDKEYEDVPYPVKAYRAYSESEPSL